MTFHMFKDMIDQFVALGGGCLYISPTVGEALIDTKLHEKLRYAKRFPELSEIHLYTNGILLTRKRFEELTTAGVDFVNVSTSGFDAGEYERVYRVKSYKKVLGNLYQISSSPLFSRCKVEIGLRSDSLFPAMKPDYKRLKGLGYSISRTLFFDNWSGRIKENNLPGCMFIRPLRKKPVPCHMLYAGPMVQQDGSIVACGCRDLEADSELYLGNIDNIFLKSAWFSKEMHHIRRRFIEGTPPRICRDCRHYAPVSIDKLKNDFNVLA